VKRLDRAEARDSPEGWPAGFAAGRENRTALLVLASLPSLTPRRLLALSVREGSASACLEAVRAGRTGSKVDQAVARAADGKAIEARLAISGARMACPGSEEYPAGLEDLADPPAVVFVRGMPLAAGVSRVAVVGARNCTHLGAEVARALGRGLAAAGVCVVSGAARGIDAESHQGALSVGGPTVAVLGCGIDLPYPPRHRDLLARIAGSGSVVSEYPPGVPAEPFRFPARNRIIAALAQAVVVVEGAEGSGSLITADHALEIGRSVFAVPGPVTSPLAAVPLGLIRDGATMIRGVEDLLSELGLTAASGGTGASGAIGATGATSASPPLSPIEAAVLSGMSGPCLPEQLARSAGCTLQEAVTALLRLEMKGLVRSVGGRYERRLTR
jgi:DNA processing protein